MTIGTRKRHSPEQVLRKLTTADRLLAVGKDVAAVCRELGVSEQTSYRWRNQSGERVGLSFIPPAARRR